MVEVVSQTKSATSPSSNKLGTSMEIPFNDTIPIIFVPGIMGSNIFNKSLGRPVWMLGNGTGMAKTIIQQMNKNPATLQKELDYLNTEVDKSGTIQVDSRLKLTEKVLRERYWGTVHWDSYGGISTYLQMVLNNVDVKSNPLHGGGNVGGVLDGFGAIQNMKAKEAIIEWQRILKTFEQKEWNAENLIPISEKDIEHLASFHFPVYAMGYNWLQSSEDGAKIVSNKLEAIKKSLGGRFHKFIIVTHSMGGLLTRRLLGHWISI